MVGDRALGPVVAATGGRGLWMGSEGLGRGWRVVDRDGGRDSCSKIRGWWVIVPWDRWLRPQVRGGRG